MTNERDDALLAMHDVDTTQRRVMLIGHPDSGKTTLARSTPGEYHTDYDQIEDDGAGGAF